MKQLKAKDRYIHFNRATFGSALVFCLTIFGSSFSSQFETLVGSAKFRGPAAELTCSEILKIETVTEYIPLFGKRDDWLAHTNANPFRFNETEYELGKAALSQPNLTNAKLSKAFWHLLDAGSEYTLSLKTLDGKEWSGRVSNNSDRAVTLEKAGKRYEIPFYNIDLNSFQFRREPVPEQIFRNSETSQAARELGITSLRTSIRYLSSTETILFKIFSEGWFDSAKSNGAVQGRVANYLEFVDAKQPLKSTMDVAPDKLQEINAVVEFDLSLLNRSDFYLNRGWQYGHYSKHSIRFDETRRLRSWLYQHSLGNGAARGHELVFLEAIPITAIQRVFLPPDTRNSLIQRLNQNKIQPPHGRSWDELLVPYTSSQN